MNTSQLIQPRRISRAGFSLVEVVLAVGIMALGVVTILGLLPHGMEISRQTANELAEGRIVDSIVADMQAMTWTDLHGLSTAAPPVRYYDDQGLQIQDGDADAMATQLTYVVKVDVPDPDVYLPTNANVPTVNQNLRRVVIKVAAVPQENFNFDSPPAGVPVRTVTQLIARTR